MEENTLLKVSIISALIGILLIIIVSERITLPDSDITSINSSMLNKNVKLKGLISFINEKPGLLILTIEDKTGKINILAYKDEAISLKIGDLIEVEGTVTEYKNQTEINAKIIKTFK